MPVWPAAALTIGFWAIVALVVWAPLAALDALINVVDTWLFKRRRRRRQQQSSR